MLAGIRDILVITRPEDEPMYSALLQDGAQWGVNISYATQPNPGGVAEGLLIGETFLDGSDCIYILGDNIFYGAGLSGFLRRHLQIIQAQPVLHIRSATPNAMALSNLMMHAT